MTPLDTRPPTDSAATRTADAACIQLRLLATTDLHGNLLPFDYFTDRDDQPYGLARTATLIRAARAEAANVLLFDNGDALQGTPLADITAQPGSGWKGEHPVVLAMNHLGYDAACLGNHEFNFGLDWLFATLRAARYGLTCGNIHTVGGDDTPLPPYLLLDRDMTDDNARSHRLRIGVLGLVPPQVAIWDAPHLDGRLMAEDMVDTARRLIPRMRAEGADIVVLLAHTGIDPAAPRPRMENAARALAALPGIDALICGHTHEVFPRQDAPCPDATAGTLAGTPTVMAGYRGSHLGVLDLTLAPVADGWQVVAHAAEARAVAGPAAVTPADPALCAALKDAHAATRAIAARPVGHSTAPLNSYLAMARCCDAVRLLARAQRDALARAVAGTGWDGVPILSASPPFKTGGRGGPHYFTDIAPGPLSLRNAADLAGFPNTLCGLRITGGELRDWLERAAICFATLTPGAQDQPLCDPSVPGHVFDLIEGLTYTIDPSAPARYTLDGTLADPDAHRIRDLRFDGQPLRDDAIFLLATNSYRASGAGPYPRPAPARIVHVGRTMMSELLAEYLRDTGPVLPGSDPVWQFAPLPGTSVLLDTGPELEHLPDQLAAARATRLGQTETGFLRLRLAL